MAWSAWLEIGANFALATAFVALGFVAYYGYDLRRKKNQLDRQLGRQRYKPTARTYQISAFAALGFLSGTISWFLIYIADIGDFRGYEIPILVLGRAKALHLDEFSLIPGLVFGVVIGVWLVRQNLAELGQSVSYILGAFGSNFAATNLAVSIHGNVNGLGLIGMIAGLFGATCLTAMSVVFLPFSRQWVSCLLMLLAGSLLGGLLVTHPFVLYALWQAGYAAALGTADAGKQAQEFHPLARLS